MRKYWKLITITVLVILTLGAFYISSSLESLKYPDLFIKHKSGDATEVENVSVSAALKDGEKNVYTNITSEGTTYSLNMSYLDLIKGADQSAIMKRLKKEHYNFMRGKSDMENQYYEDEHLLAYVNMRSDYGASGYGQWRYSFEVDVLDKASNKTSAFKVSIPDNEKFNYVHIQRIQIIDGQIKVFSTNDLITRDDQHNVSRTELHLYSISLKDEEMIRDDRISDTDEINPSYSVSTNLLSNNEKTKLNKNVVYSVDINEETMTDDGYQEYKMRDQQLIAYDLSTNEQKKIELPDKYGDDVMPEFQSGNMIYFSHENEGKLELHAYNLESEKIEGKQTFDLLSKDDKETSSYVFNDNKIYQMHQLKADEIDTTIIISDIKTGDVLYEGSIAIAKASKNKYDIEMMYLEVR